MSGEVRTFSKKRILLSVSKYRWVMKLASYLLAELNKL
jgi:hypothetical protein